MRNRRTAERFARILAAPSAAMWAGSRRALVASTKRGRRPVPPGIGSRTTTADDADATEVVVVRGPAPHGASPGLQLVECGFVHAGLRVDGLRSGVEARPGHGLDG